MCPPFFHSTLSVKAARSIAARAAVNIDAATAIAVAAFATLARPADQRAGNSADSATNDGTLNRIAGDGSADRRPAQSADSSALLRL